VHISSKIDRPYEDWNIPGSYRPYMVIHGVNMTVYGDK